MNSLNSVEQLERGIASLQAYAMERVLLDPVAGQQELPLFLLTSVSETINVIQQICITLRENQSSSLHSNMECNPELLLIRAQNKLGGLFEREQLSVTSAVALLHAIQQLATTRKALDAANFITAENHLADVIIPLVMGLQVVLASMGREMNQMPSPKIMARVESLISVDSNPTETLKTIPHLLSWVDKTLFHAQRNIEKVIPLVSDQCAHQHILEYMTQLMHEMRSQFDADTPPLP